MLLWNCKLQNPILILSLNFYKLQLILYLSFAEQLEKFTLNPEDEKAVWNIIEQPVGFVVLGSCCWARAMVVNQLMGRNILPIIPFGETESRWRMVSSSYFFVFEVSHYIALNLEKHLLFQSKFVMLFQNKFVMLFHQESLSAFLKYSYFMSVSVISNYDNFNF